MPVPVPLKAENEFRLTAEELKAAITPKTKLLVLPFPCNPTGAVMEKEHLEAIAQVLRGTDIMVLSDEIYAELNYGTERHVSIASLPGMAERTIVVNGFSKAFAMTSQYAAVVAMRECDDEIERMRREYDVRRRLLVKRFNDMGMDCFEPKGAFYVFPSIQRTGLSSADFCEKLLYSQKVAVVPGTAFGDSGEGFVRVSYAYSVNHLTEALGRIERFLEELGVHG